MKKRRVLLACSQRLFGEGLEKLLQNAEDVEVVGPWEVGSEILNLIPQVKPDAVIVVDEDPACEAVSRLTVSIMEQYPDTPVIRAGLEQKVFRVFTTHTLPASGFDLLETIRDLAVGSQWRLAGENHEE